MKNAPVKAITVSAEENGKNIIITMAITIKSPKSPSLKGMTLIALIPTMSKQGVSINAILLATTAASAALPEEFVVKEKRYAPINTSDVTRLADI